MQSLAHDRPFGTASCSSQGLLLNLPCISHLKCHSPSSGLLQAAVTRLVPKLPAGEAQVPFPRLRLGGLIPGPPATGPCSFSALWGSGSLHSPPLLSLCRSFRLCPKIVQPEISTTARQEKGPSPLQQPRLDGSFLNSRPTENSRSELLGFYPSGGWVSPVSTNWVSAPSPPNRSSLIFSTWVLPGNRISLAHPSWDWMALSGVGFSRSLGDLYPCVAFFTAVC